jgi:exodeoxyribonuclease VII small subunit
MSETVDPAPASSGLSFEEALARLEAIVQQLERGDVPLEKSIDLYVEGDRLRAQCQTRLEAAQARIEQIVTGPGGEATGTRGFETS